MPSYHVTQGLFASSNCFSETRFDRLSSIVLNHFSKKWYPTSARREYLTTFSIHNWKELSEDMKQQHILSSCQACFDKHPALQRAYPGKPMYMYEPQTPTATMVSLPPLSKERDLARNVLAELNPMWENRFLIHLQSQCLQMYQNVIWLEKSPELK